MLVQTEHRFSVADYYRMGETGVLKPGARVELLAGKILVEVYREPHLAGYGSNQTLRAGDKASPLAFPEVELGVSQMLSLAK